MPSPSFERERNGTAKRLKEKWRKCMGIEPTRRTVYVRRNGFEDRGRHQAYKHFRIACFPQFIASFHRCLPAVGARSIARGWNTPSRRPHYNVTCRRCEATSSGVANSSRPWLVRKSGTPSLQRRMQPEKERERVGRTPGRAGKNAHSTSNSPISQPAAARRPSRRSASRTATWWPQNSPGLAEAPHRVTKCRIVAAFDAMVGQNLRFTRD